MLSRGVIAVWCAAFLNAAAACLPAAPAEAQAAGSRRPVDPDESNLTVLVTDAKTGKLSSAELTRLAKKGLERVVENRGPSDPGWVDLVVIARSRGLVSDQDWKSFAAAALSFQCEFREQLRSGGMALVHPQLSGVRGSDAFQGHLIYAISEIRFESVTVPISPPWKLVTQFGPGKRGGMPRWLKVDVPPGKYHVTLPVKIERFTVGSVDDTSTLSFDTEVDLGVVDVVRSEFSLVQPLDDAALRDSFMADTSPVLHIMDNYDTRMTPAISFQLGRSYRGPMNKTSADALVSRPHVHLVFKDGTTRDVVLPPIWVRLEGNDFFDSCQAPVPPELPEIAYADVTLAPDPEAAAGVPGVKRLWTGTVNLPHIGMTRRPQ